MEPVSLHTQDPSSVLGFRVPPFEVIESLLVQRNCDEQMKVRLLELCRLETELAASGAWGERNAGWPNFLELLHSKIDGHAQMSLDNFCLHFNKELMLQAEINKNQEEAEDILSLVVPGLEDAREKLQRLRMSDFCEARCYLIPPRLVIRALEAVCILLGVEPEGEAGYWRPAKQFLLSRAAVFLKTIETFDMDNVPKIILHKLQPYIESNEFTFESMNICSSLAAALCSWVKAIYSYASICDKVQPMRQRNFLLLQELQDCQRSQPWYHHGFEAGEIIVSTTWNSADVAHSKAHQMLELKINCFMIGMVMARTDPGSATFGQVVREYKRALATLEAWAGNAASEQAAMLAACMIERSPRDGLEAEFAARIELWAAMWVPPHASALEEREDFAALAMLLPRITPMVNVDLQGGHKSRVSICLVPACYCGAEHTAASWKTALLNWQTSGVHLVQVRLRIRRRLASDGSVWDQDEYNSTFSCETSQEIVLKAARWSPTADWSYAFACVPDVVTACLSVRIGTKFLWSAWSGETGESEVLLPAPKPQGQLIVARVSDTSAILQWQRFCSHERLTKIQYRLVARLVDGDMETSINFHNVDECDVVTTLIVDCDATRDVLSAVVGRVAGLSPGSAYLFAVAARYMDVDILHWSAFLVTDVSICTQHDLPASFPVSITSIGGGDPTELDMGASENVASLKDALSRCVFIPAACQKLQSAGLTLADDDLLRDYFDNGFVCLLLIVAASADDVSDMLEKAATDHTRKPSSTALEALEFALKDEDCGPAMFRLFEHILRFRLKEFLSTAKDLAHVALSGASLTSELRKSLLELDTLFSRKLDRTRSSVSPVVGCVFTALAKRGDQLALAEMKQLLFHNSREVWESALVVVLSSKGDSARNSAVDSYVEKLRSERYIQRGLPQLENLALLAPRPQAPLLMALQHFFTNCWHSPSRLVALKVMAQLDPASDATIAATNFCLEKHEVDFLYAALSVLPLPQLEAISCQDNWPFVKRAAARAIVNRFGTSSATEKEKKKKKKN